MLLSDNTKKLKQVFVPLIEPEWCEATKTPRQIHPTTERAAVLKAKKIGFNENRIQDHGHTWALAILSSEHATSIAVGAFDIKLIIFSFKLVPTLVWFRFVTFVASHHLPIRKSIVSDRGSDLDELYLVRQHEMHVKC